MIGKRTVKNLSILHLVFMLFAVIGLAFVGLITAFSPVLSVALTAMSILAVIVAFALFHDDVGPMKIKNINILILMFVGVTVFWPTFLNLHIPLLPTLNLRRLLGMGMMALIIYLLMSRRSVRQNLVPDHLTERVVLIIAVLMILIRIYSAFSAPFFGSAIAFVFWEICLYFSIFLFAVLCLKVEESRKFFINALLVSAIFCALIAIIEASIGKNFFVDLLSPLSSDREGLNAMMLSRYREGVLRAQGPFEHPLLLAEFGSVVFVFALALLLWPAQSQSRWFVIIGITSALICVVLSYSRSALICTAIGSAWLVALWFLRPKVRTDGSRAFFRLVILGVSITLLALLSWGVVQDIAQGRSHAESESTASRSIMMNKGIDLMSEKPILGFGVGTGVALAGVISRGIPTLDNYFIMIGVESGLPYLCLFMLFFIIPVMKSAFQVLRGDAESAFLSAASAALISLFVMRSVLGITYNIPIAFFLVGALIAIQVGSRKVD